jgi:hypothetical protein
MRKYYKLFALIALGVGVGACADQAYDPDAPALDPNVPRIHILTPAFGTFAGDVAKVTVTGTVTDDGEVKKVTVNDVAATVKADGSFTAQVPVKAGTNLLHVVAEDGQDNVGQETRAVVAGPVATLGRQVPNAIAVTLTKQTLDTVSKAATDFVQNGDLLATVSPMNPVVDAGGGPDCLFGQVKITGMDVATANISMVPVDGGIKFSAVLNKLDVGLNLKWAVACLDGSRNISVGADKITISGLLRVGVASKQFDIALENQNVSITNLDLDLGGVPGEIVDMIKLDKALGPILGFATERFVVPKLNKALYGLNDTKTIDLFGREVAITVTPAKVEFTPAGGTIFVNTELRAKNDKGGFVYVGNAAPMMDMSQGIQLAIADDAANQLLTSLWSADALGATLDLKTGSYADLGKLYDAVELETMVPPYIDASSDRVVMTIGDMIASFKLGAAAKTKVAINAEVGLKIIDDNGALRLDVGEPTTFVDILEDGVIGSNPLSNAQFEEIISFALSRIVSVGSGSVGAIPMPTVGPVGVQTLSIGPQTGYLVIGGDIALQ